MTGSQITTWRVRGFLGMALVGALIALGCEGETAVQPTEPPKEPILAKRTRLSKNVQFEAPEGGPRRVVVNAVVCLRDGPLEGLLTLREGKEHEYVLSADCNAADIHTALIAAGAEPGSPAVFGQDGKYAPARGSIIKVTLQYKTRDGHTISRPGQQWIRNRETKKPLDSHWVFGGSVFVPDPEDPKKPPFYAANEGDVICVYNMPHAMLDLPVVNPNVAPESRLYDAFTEKIPPLGTRVDIILEPVGKKKDKN